MVEAFVPLFGQELGGLVPLSAGFLGAALSVGWTSSQLLSVSLSSDAGKRRVRLLGPVLLTLGLVGY
ncbi:MFS transporter, partial [Escherichia coli]|nr:MFS transporter [Escherichia coli]